MADRAKYLTLVVALYAVGMCVLVAAVATLFDREFLEVIVNLAPALIICFLGVIIHGLRHDLDS
ncbi:hypothetical protein [Brachybacterium alimentarium]|uniref:hypothetical protein n=1 Tax=Brachybacterium alimentarium TaxID=47845 RepID=UPI003FCF0138